jgi:hypothetical protein
MAMLQQLTAANLALTATFGTLTATNKKLVDAASRPRDPRRELRQVGRRRQKLPSPATIVGRTATASARSTQVQLAPTKPSATALMPLLRIPWVAARRTRVEARRAPDRGGWQMLSIAVLMICVKTIIIMLYPHLPAVIPPTFHLPTLASPTPVPVDFTLRPALPLQISTQNAPSVGVRVANSLPERSVASATLASVPSLPPAAMQGHVMPSFPHTLIGLDPFADLGCSIVFTKTAVNIIDPDDQSILEGWREQDGP